MLNTRRTVSEIQLPQFRLPEIPSYGSSDTRKFFIDQIHQAHEAFDRIESMAGTPIIEDVLAPRLVLALNWETFNIGEMYSSFIEVLSTEFIKTVEKRIKESCEEDADDSRLILAPCSRISRASERLQEKIGESVKQLILESRGRYSELIFSIPLFLTEKLVRVDFTFGSLAFNNPNSPGDTTMDGYFFYLADTYEIDLIKLKRRQIKMLVRQALCPCHYKTEMMLIPHLLRTMIRMMKESRTTETNEPGLSPVSQLKRWLGLILCGEMDMRATQQFGMGAAHQLNRRAAQRLDMRTKFPF